MSSVNRSIPPFKAINAGDMSGNLTGIETNVISMETLTYHIDWAGDAPVGEIFIEFLKTPALKSATNLDVWETLQLGSQILVSGDSGEHTVIFTSLPFTMLRPRYEFTSGTGALTITLIGKGF